MSEEAGAVDSSPEVSDSTEAVESASPEATEGSEGVEGAEDSEESTEEVAPSPLYDIVVDGETLQVPLDDLLAGYQLKSASNKRFQEAAAERKQAQEEAEQIQAFKQQLLNNPFEALQKENIPFEHIRDHYENVVYQMLQMDEMSDEEKASIKQQRETERLRSEYEDMQKQLEAHKRQEEERSFSQEVQKQQEYWSGKIIDAIEGGGLPATPEAVRYVANTLKTAADNEYELDINDAVSMYKEESSSSLKGLLSNMSEDALAQLIGEERMNKIRKKDLEKLKNPSLPAEPFVSKTKAHDSKESASDFFKNLRQSTYKR